MEKEYKHMTYLDKLEYFGLQDNYTEDELKQKYRELSRKYHPDLIVGKSEEEIEVAKQKFQLVNNIHEDLKKLVSNKSSDVSYESPFDELFNEQKNRYLKSLEDLIKDPKLSGKVYPEYYDDAIKEITLLIGVYTKNVKALYSNNNIDRLYNLIRDNVKKSYKKFCKKYCEDCSLKYKFEEYFEVEGILIRLDCPLRALFEKLETVKNNVINENIQSVLDRYKNEEALRVFKTSVEKLAKEALEEYDKSHYSVNIMRAKFAGDIDELISKYNEVKTKLLSISRFLDTVLEESEDVKSIKDEYNSYNNQFSNGIFPDEEKLNGFIGKVESFKKEYEKRKNSQIIGQIMDSVSNNFNVVINEARNTLDINSLKVATIFFNKALELLDKLKNGEIDREVGLLLAELSFKDIPHDIGILNSVLNNVLVLENSNIYVRLGKIVTLFDSAFNTLSVSDGKCLLEGVTVTGEFNSKEVSIETILNNYINLDVLLEKVPIDGRTFFDGEREVIVLCGWNGNALVLNSTGTLEIRNASSIKTLTNEKTRDKFQDKDYILNMVKNSINVEQKSVRV